MKRTARLLFSLSGTGFIASVGLWFLVLSLESAQGHPVHGPLEPRLPMRVLAATVLLSMGLAALAALLALVGWFRHRVHPRSRHA
jgi:hypothetical protein